MIYCDVKSDKRYSTITKYDKLHSILIKAYKDKHLVALGVTCTDEDQEHARTK